MWSCHDGMANGIHCKMSCYKILHPSIHPSIFWVRAADKEKGSNFEVPRLDTLILVAEP